MYNTRLVKAEIDLDALAFNVKQIRSLLKPQTKLLTVVKANAYGHGALAISKELENLEADMLGVACIYEAQELRMAKIKLPILNFGPLLAEDVETIFEFDFIPTVFSLEIAQAISKEAIKKNKTIDIHIKVDTGLNRIGVASNDAVKLIKEIKKLANINVAGLYTHFALAEDTKNEATKIQLKNFNNVLDELKKENISIPLIHAANSAATIFWSEAHFDMVRIGIAMYGCKPSDEEKMPIELKPLLTLKTYISHLKMVSENTPISYGWKFTTKKTSQIATIAVGYADGFRRTPYNWGNVLINEKKAAVVGIVCMDQSMVDASGIEGIKVGDEVILIGKQGKSEITLWDVANQLQTSAYEVWCAMTSRVKRVYIKNGK